VACQFVWVIFLQLGKCIVSYFKRWIVQGDIISVFHRGARACFIPGGTGHWVGPNAIPKSSPGLCQDTEVSECWRQSCVHVLLIVSAINCMYCVYVWWPSVGVPIGSVRLQVSHCWGMRGRGEGLRLNDLRPRLCPGLRSADVLHSMTCVQLVLQLQHPPPAPSSEARCRSSTAAAAELHVGWI